MKSSSHLLKNAGKDIGEYSSSSFSVKIWKGKSGLLTLVIMFMFIAYPAVSGITGEVFSSRAYKGHENDQDADNFARVYPSIVGTRLDDCQTCHRAGMEGTDTERIYNSCEYCHLITFPSKKFRSGVPHEFEDTLNSFGKAYKAAGRSPSALRSIGKKDSDGDGYSNGDEIVLFRYPGNPDSKPDQPLAPVITLGLEEIIRLPVLEQFLLMNTHKQKYDDYVLFTGLRIRDILFTAGVDVKSATGITVFAPDGYSQDLGMDDILKEFPNGIFYLVPEFQDHEKDLVRYPNKLPPGLKDKGAIPNPLWLMIAFKSNHENLAAAHYESNTGRLSGEGPYRLITPQHMPGRPDRGSTAEKYHDGWDFDETIDHNAGRSVRGACVIRVNPVPDGFEEYDWKNGWSLIEERKIVIYGHSIK